MRVARRSVLLLLVLGAFSGPAAADWRETFAEGVRAWDLGQWRKAARLMRRAIDERPEETGEKVRVYGMKWERYLPNYYLGMALYELNDCRAALAAFEASRDHGEVGLVGRSLMTRREEDCRNRVGAPPPSSGSSGQGRSSGSTSQGGRGGSRRVDPGSSSSSSTGSSASSSSPPAPKTTKEARREALTEKVSEAEESLRRAGRVTRIIDGHLDRTGRRAFRRSSKLEERYQGAYRQLNNARFLLRAGRRENDLQAVTRAGSEADSALAELEAVARELGVAKE
jgi:hypothetical protein